MEKSNTKIVKEIKPTKAPVSGTVEKVEELSITVNKLMIAVVLLFIAVGALSIYAVKDYTATVNKEKVLAAQKTSQKEKQDPFQVISKYPQVTNEDHVRGNKKAQYLLVEYSDLECPFCKRFHPIAKQFIADMKGSVSWVYRHFPLDSIHSQARDEAIASECVMKSANDEAFWKFVDTVFEVTPGNNGLDLSKIPGMAEESGADMNVFTPCYDNKDTKSIVEKQYQTGIALNVSGTPANYLINVKTRKAVFVPGAYPIDQLKIALNKIK